MQGFWIDWGRLHQLHSNPCPGPDMTQQVSQGDASKVAGIDISVPLGILTRVDIRVPCGSLDSKEGFHFLPFLASLIPNRRTGCCPSGPSCGMPTQDRIGPSEKEMILCHRQQLGKNASCFLQQFRHEDQCF